MSGAKHRQKGNRIEREIVALHLELGVHSERYPLSGASRFRGSGHDIDIYCDGQDAAPLVAEVKARKDGSGFIQLEKWLGEYDLLFLRRNNAEPLVVLPWRTWAALLAKVRRSRTQPTDHSRFGGSVAARVLHCPASVGLVAKVPACLRKISAYAERGTALHLAMTQLIENASSLDDLVGEMFNDYTLTADDVENALQPTYVYAAQLLDAPGAEFYLEQRVVFPTLPGAFGTVDLIIRIGRTIYVIDFKFGTGVRVLALYPAGDEDILNTQLMFYAAAARHSLPEFFAGVDEIVLTILQPQSIDPDAEMVSSVAATTAELDDFVTVYRVACDEALTPAPRLQGGDWCRFCPARPICPVHTGPLLDLAQFAMPALTPAAKEAYLQALADGLDLVDAVKDLRTALHDQAKRALENGDRVPGYALSAGRAERHWRDEDAAIGALIRLGFARGDVLAETMRSPKQVELRAKARGLQVPKELIVSRHSGVSLVRGENVRVPVPGRGEIARSFAAALETFQKGEI